MALYTQRFDEGIETSNERIDEDIAETTLLFFPEIERGDTLD